MAAIMVIALSSGQRWIDADHSEPDACPDARHQVGRHRPDLLRCLIHHQQLDQTDHAASVVLKFDGI